MTTEPLLGIVIIARNEERHIAACVERTLAAARRFSRTQVILVDSDSTDETVAIASRYPITIYRYRSPVRTAAAGRRIGFEYIAARYVLFLDGDCCIEEKWLAHAMVLMEADRKAAVIHGALRESADGAVEECKSIHVSPEESGLGGNALYKSSALRMAGGFNPFIIAEEEGELFGRIQAAGYHAIRTPEVMVTHYTLPKDTMRRVIRRHLRGLSRGPGQVLRLSIRQGLFSYHARRFNRYLLALAYLAVGAVLTVVAAIRTDPSPLVCWLTTGLAAFVWLSFRRRGVRSAFYIAVDWGVVGMTMAQDFFVRPKCSEMFNPVVERMK